MPLMQIIEPVLFESITEPAIFIGHCNQFIPMRLTEGNVNLTFILDWLLWAYVNPVKKTMRTFAYRAITDECIYRG